MIGHSEFAKYKRAQLATQDPLSQLFATKRITATVWATTNLKNDQFKAQTSLRASIQTLRRIFSGGGLSAGDHMRTENNDL